MKEEQRSSTTYVCKHGILGTEKYCQGCLGHPRYYSDGERGWDKVIDATAYNRMIHSEGLPPGVCNEEPLEWTGITWANAELTRLRALVAHVEDVEGIAQLLWLLDAPKANPDEWNKFTPRLKQPYLENATTLSAWLLKGG